MEKLTMCRICLVEDVSMYEVANKNLQEMYEKLTDIPFVTEDCRPMLACFFCYTKLKQCCQLLRKCLKAEEVFAQMLNGDYKQIPLQSRGEIEFYGGFNKAPMQHMSIDDVCQIGSGAISEQLPAVCDTQDVIKIKEEYPYDEVKMEYEDSYVYQEVIPPHHSESDSEDDVPLMNFKIEIEEEQEAPEESTRAPVAKKPKLEDTTTDKQKENGLSDSKFNYTTGIITSKSVAQFREPIINDNFPKSTVNNSILNKDKEIIEESLLENVKEVTNTAIHTNYRNNSNKDHFGIKILNEKGFLTVMYSGDINEHKICEPYTCDICQRSFTQNESLKLHIRTHTGEKPYECDICQRSFNDRCNFNKHIRGHTGEKSYQCDLCQRSFTEKQYLKSHIRVHSGEKPYKCEICQRSFSAHSHLNRHIRVHTGEKPYKCKICQRSFNDQSHLNRHIRIHPADNPYKCNICKRSFSQNEYLQLHILTHTGEKPYKCEICQRSFTNQGNLNRHIRTHTGEKPYKCEICQRSFYNKGYLNTHIRIHTGEKPYKCDVCQRSFIQKQHLKLHIQTHTGEKPHKCDICHRSFIQKQHLKLHIRTHTGENSHK